jgi:hypothetical protein
MHPVSHVSLAAPLAAAIAWQAGPAPAAWFAGGAVLIDLDHYLFFILRTGRYNPVEMFTWFREADERCTATSYYGLCVLHAAEAFVLVALAAIFLPVLAWLLLGMGYHLLLDYIWLYRHPVLSMKVRAVSWIEHLVRRKRGERECWREPDEPDGDQVKRTADNLRGRR